MHIYAFGSICRGEIDRTSDIDLLALVGGYDSRFDPSVYSVYSYVRMEQLWKEGNPFAWHLALESKLIFTTDGIDWLAARGLPSRYRACTVDCAKFQSLFATARDALAIPGAAVVFEFSTVFLAIRNIATCFSLSRCESPAFGRDSALRLGSWSLPVDPESYDVLRRARILSTRGVGPRLEARDTAIALQYLSTVAAWMTQLVEEASRYE